MRRTVFDPIDRNFPTNENPGGYVRQQMKSTLTVPAIAVMSDEQETKPSAV